MRFDGPGSDNFQDRTGQSGGFSMGGAGAGIFGLLFQIVASKFGIVGIIILALGYCALTSLGGGGGVVGQKEGPSKLDPATGQFMTQVLGSTEKVWTDIFRQSGAQYKPTTLVAYSNLNQSGCGAAQAAMGPFYCPTDQDIYIDPIFFDELSKRFQAPGDAAAAYVIAHEVGHHVQNLEGTLAAGPVGAGQFGQGRRQPAPGRGRAAGRLLRRRVGQALGRARAGRHRGRDARGRGDRRRYAAEADPGPRRARKLHPRQRGAAHGGAPARAPHRRPGAVQLRALG